MYYSSDLHFPFCVNAVIILCINYTIALHCHNIGLTSFIVVYQPLSVCIIYVIELYMKDRSIIQKVHYADQNNTAHKNNVFFKLYNYRLCSIILFELYIKAFASARSFNAYEQMVEKQFSEGLK